MSDTEKSRFNNPPETVQDLLGAWQMRADELRETELRAVARAYERCARDLRALHYQLREKELTLEEAAEECGYSPRHLRRLAREDRLNHVERDGTLYLRRLDLPRKPRPPYVATEDEVYDEPL